MRFPARAWSSPLYVVDFWEQVGEIGTGGQGPYLNERDLIPR